jgi:outer membrane protein assembly factor BamE (lipoprotein component of BamABCDE complex)
MRRNIQWSSLMLATLLLTACAQYENRRGVDVNWQQSVTENLVRGESTRQDTLALLGPPSQVISLDNGTVLYYLFERSRGTGLILLVYNDFTVDTSYDRAIFFFDGDNRLTDYATHINPTNEG